MLEVKCKWVPYNCVPYKTFTPVCFALAKLARRLGAPTARRGVTRVAGSMDRLHIELLATRPLDFWDAPCFAATCTVARTAILSGPLLLWTDIERMITVAQLERLLQLIAWCGHSVRSLPM